MSKRGFFVALVGALAMVIAGCGAVEEENGGAQEDGECRGQQIDSVACECGFLISRACEGGQWGDWSDDCVEICPAEEVEDPPEEPEEEEEQVDPPELECEPRDTRARDCDQACMISVSVCGPEGVWSDWGACQQDPMCEDDPAQCVDGEVQQTACNGCGRTLRACRGGQWGGWGACDESACPVTCDEGARQTRACGECGTSASVCQRGEWSDFGACEVPEGGCLALCESLETVYESVDQDFLSDFFLGMALLPNGAIAATSKSMELGYFRIIDADNGEVRHERMYGDWFNDTTVTSLSSPVYDAASGDLFHTHATWQAQFGDDGPELFLNRTDTAGEGVWSSHVWSYREFYRHTFDTARPLRVGDRILVSSAGNSFGDGPIEQIRGFDLGDGAMSWSVESPLQGTLVGTASGESVYHHGSGLTFRIDLESSALRLLHYSGAQSARISWPMALSRDGGTLYAATGMLHLDIDPQRDIVVALDTASEDPESSRWRTLLAPDQIISDGLVLTEALVIVPLGDGIMALRRDNGATAWVHLTGQPSSSPVVGDDGLIYFTSWAEDEVTLRAVTEEGQPRLGCLVSNEGRDIQELGNGGLYFGGRIAPLIEGGRMWLAVGRHLMALDVPSDSLADTGWPRLGADNHNSGLVPGR